MSEPAGRVTMRVYWEDTDGAGIVYHANHLAFAERARTELLRRLGFGQRALLEGDGVAFVVRRLTIDYRRPAHLDDLLTVDTAVASVARASLDLVQTIARDGREIAVLRVQLACVDRQGRPVRLPAEIGAAFAAAQDGSVADGVSVQAARDHRGNG